MTRVCVVNKLFPRATSTDMFRTLPKKRSLQEMLLVVLSAERVYNTDNTKMPTHHAV